MRRFLMTVIVAWGVANTATAQFYENSLIVARPGEVYAPYRPEPRRPVPIIPELIPVCDLSPVERDVPNARPALYLDARLQNCTRLRDGITWQEPNGEKLQYTDWPSEKKTRLNHFFQALLRGDYDLGARCPDPREALQPPDYRIYYDYAEAFDVFAAYVAHVLYLEAQDLVPWKVNDMPLEEAAQLLDSEAYFSVIRPTTRLDMRSFPDHIEPGEDYQALGWSQPHGPMLCDPRQGYRDFHRSPGGPPHVSGESVVESDMATTLARLTLWMRDNLQHAPGRLRDMPEHFIRAFQTLGPRVRRQQYENGLAIRAFSGCHGAAGLLREVARSLNIPLLLVATGDTPARPGLTLASRTHKGLCYRWDSPEGRCLWHLDDIYAYASDEPTFPVSWTGQPVRGTPLALEYFDIHWPLIGDLEESGFDVQMADAVPSPVPDTPFYTSLGDSEPYFSYGTYLGHWRLSDRARDIWEETGGQGFYHEYLDLSLYYRFVNLVQSRSWYLLDDACDGVRQVQADLAALMQGLSSLYPPRLTYTTGDIDAFIEETLAAYRGQFGHYGAATTDCRSVTAIREAWLQNR